MSRYCYLIYYALASGRTKLEGNMVLDRVYAIDSECEVENIRNHIASRLAHIPKAIKIFKGGGEIVIANIMNLQIPAKDAGGLEMIHKCTKCGHEDEINPAAEMGRKKKTMTPKATAQRKAAADKRWDKVREEKAKTEA